MVGMFKKTGAKLELLTDENMFLTFEEDIRGGICNKVHMQRQIINT